MEKPLFLVEGLVTSVFGVAAVGIPWCERERLENTTTDGAISLDTLKIRHGQNHPGVQGLRNIRVISNPTGNPVTLQISDTVIHLPVKSASEIIWLRNTYNGPDDLYFYHDRSLKIEPKDAVLLADEVVLNDERYLIEKVDRPYVVHPLPESHKNFEGIMACKICSGIRNFPDKTY